MEMYATYRLREDDKDGQMWMYTKEAAEAISGLSGQDMSWTVYNRIADNIIALDFRIKNSHTEEDTCPCGHLDSEHVHYCSADDLGACSCNEEYLRKLDIRSTP